MTVNLQSLHPFLSMVHGDRIGHHTVGQRSPHQHQQNNVFFFKYVCHCKEVGSIMYAPSTKTVPPHVDEVRILTNVFANQHQKRANSRPGNQQGSAMALLRP